MEKQLIAEVLAPAGSFESLIAAIHAGADAVYIGGDKFGARAYAENFAGETLIEAIRFVHLHGKKLYLTVNTLLKEDERKEQLYNYLLPLYEAGLDAVIVQDLGVLSFIRRNFPELDIHASTQMTITGPFGAAYLESLGVTRVVPAREISIQEIKAIREHTKLEIESFVHGALCYSYSGQCLFSSMLGGRSGNRGRCAQPCRMNYQVSMQGKVISQKDGSYALSPKDICTLSILPDLIEAGVYSLKIEGRMKKPEYTAFVTAMYRKYVDLYCKVGKAGYHVDEQDLRDLMDIYNRGGFSCGYYKTRNSEKMMALSRPNHTGVKVARIVSAKGRTLQVKTMLPLGKGDVIEIPCKGDKVSNWTSGSDVSKNQVISIRTEFDPIVRVGDELCRIRNEKLIKSIHSNYIDIKKKEKINGSFILLKEKPAILKIEYNSVQIEVKGSIPREALNQSVTKEQIEKQLSKLGATEFIWEQLFVEVEDGLFYSMTEVNQLRRDGIEQLKEAVHKGFERKKPLYQELSSFEQREDEEKIYVGISSFEQLSPVLEDDRVRRVYVDVKKTNLDWELDACNRIHAAKKECYFALPYVFRPKKSLNYGEFVASMEVCNPDGYLVRNLEEYGFLKQCSNLPLVADAGLYSFNKEAKAFLEGEGFEHASIPYELTLKEMKERGIFGDELIVYGYQPLMITANCLKKTYRFCDETESRLVLKDRKQTEFSVETVCGFCYNIIYNSIPLYLCDVTSSMNMTKRYQFTTETSKEVTAILSGKKPDAMTRGHFKNEVL